MVIYVMWFACAATCSLHKYYYKKTTTPICC